MGMLFRSRDYVFGIEIDSKNDWNISTGTLDKQAREGLHRAAGLDPGRIETKNAQGSEDQADGHGAMEPCRNRLARRPNANYWRTLVECNLCSIPTYHHLSVDT